MRREDASSIRAWRGGPLGSQRRLGAQQVAGQACKPKPRRPHLRQRSSFSIHGGKCGLAELLTDLITAYLGIIWTHTSGTEAFAEQYSSKL